MKKIIHVHSDHKFIHDIGKYQGELFINELIILDSKNEYNKKYHDQALFFNPNQNSLKTISEIIDNADIVVFYELDFYKCQIVNLISINIIIIWRFFGNELYSRKLHLVLSRPTKLLLVKNILLWKFKSMAKVLFSEERAFYQALGRIDAMTGVFEEEYEYLTKYWSRLPKFITLALEDEYFKGVTDNISFSKSKTLVIGNSRSFYNNHLEILDLIKNYNVSDNLKIKIPFNYGDERRYTRKVKERALTLNNVTIIDTFIPLEEYKNFYNKVGAVVNNSYRQFALGNIFLSLNKGVKVYLNTKSPTFRWLKTEGFYIYSIENLKEDLITGKLSLTKNQALHNLKNMEKLKLKKTKQDFQLEIYNLSDPVEEH